jgi:D-alanyl-D-alanine endopeptidase (penicillin-binding protein 7)
MCNPNTAAAALSAYRTTLQGNDLDLKSSAALVVDQKSGVRCMPRISMWPTSIASITKLMTAMVTLDAALPLDEEIEVNATIWTASRAPVPAWPWAPA